MACAPNLGFDGNLSMHTFRGLHLVAFGSGKRVVILLRDSMSVVDVTEELEGIVHAVCWGSFRKIDPRFSKGPQKRNTGPYEASGCMQGVLAVAMNEAVVVLTPHRLLRDYNNVNQFDWKWKRSLRLECCCVLQLIWCPVSNFLVTSSISVVAGWNVIERAETEGSNVISEPDWQTDRFPSFDEADSQRVNVSRMSFSCDGVCALM